MHNVDRSFLEECIAVLLEKVHFSRPSQMRRLRRTQKFVGKLNEFIIFLDELA